ncbi:MAG TPA: hypothetical protein VN807_06890 [Candidatus Sulfotelmatobacter sp.]|jgi:hypothetical protein|nr:hypothetical protein [Candidatus Sulfotelmatobacter sp.]
MAGSSRAGHFSLRNLFYERSRFAGKDLILNEVRDLRLSVPRLDQAKSFQE